MQMDADHAIIVLVATKIDGTLPSLAMALKATAKGSATCSRLIGLLSAVTMMRRRGDYSSCLRRNGVSSDTEVARLVL